MDIHDLNDQVGAVAQPDEPIVSIPHLPAGANKWYQLVITYDGNGKHTCKCCSKTFTHNNIKAYGNFLRHFTFNPTRPEKPEPDSNIVLKISFSHDHNYRLSGDFFISSGVQKHY